MKGARCTSLFARLFFLPSRRWRRTSCSLLWPHVVWATDRHVKSKKHTQHIAYPDWYVHVAACRARIAGTLRSRTSRTSRSERLSTAGNTPKATPVHKWVLRIPKCDSISLLARTCTHCYPYHYYSHSNYDYKLSY